MEALLELRFSQVIGRYALLTLVRFVEQVLVNPPHIATMGSRYRLANHAFRNQESQSTDSRDADAQ